MSAATSQSHPRSTVVNPYDARLHYATSPEAWATLRRRFGQTSEVPTSIGRTDRFWDSRTGRTHMLVWVDVAKHTDAPALLCTIAHEGYHAAAGLLEGLHQTLDESEAVAYLVDWTTGWLVRHTPGLVVTLAPPEAEETP